MKSLRHLIQRVENSEAALVQIFFYQIASRLVRNVGPRFVFAREKSTRQGEITKNSQTVFYAHRFECFLVLRAIVKVIFHLETLVPWQSVPSAQSQRVRKSFGAVIGCADGAYLPLLHQLRVSL